jgi:hypothetical protein
MSAKGHQQAAIQCPLLIPGRQRSAQRRSAEIALNNLVEGTGLVTDALDSSKMTLMRLTARNKANVRSQTKHSLAKVCGAAASVPSWSDAVKWPAFSNESPAKEGLQ